MTTKDDLEKALFIFIKDKTFSSKEKIDILADISAYCQNAMTIFLGNGIFNANWLINCLEEIVEENK